MNKKPRKYTVYADGSSKGNGTPKAKGGWACIVVKPDGTEETFSGNELRATNNQMELQSVIIGIQYINGLESYSTDEVFIDVVSDSEYVIKGAGLWIKKWVRTNFKKIKNRYLWERLILAAGSYRLRWTWVKGHAGHPYNELCDKLAQSAADQLKG